MTDVLINHDDGGSRKWHMNKPVIDDKNNNNNNTIAYRASSQAHASFMIVRSSCIGRPAASLERTVGSKFWILLLSGSAMISSSP
jgi:hypothetical protein